MKTRYQNTASLFLFCFLILSFELLGQNYDLIEERHVIDAKNGVYGLRDIAISGGNIARVVNNTAGNAEIVVNAKGMYITPGIVDMHNFHGTPGENLSNGYHGLPSDGFTLRAVLTTIVDVGSSGWKNLDKLKTQTIDRAKTRMFAFLNIVGVGIKGDAREQDMGDMDAKLTVQRYRIWSLDEYFGIVIIHMVAGETC